MEITTAACSSVLPFRNLPVKLALKLLKWLVTNRNETKCPSSRPSFRKKIRPSQSLNQTYNRNAILKTIHHQSLSKNRNAVLE